MELQLIPENTALYLRSIYVPAIASHDLCCHSLTCMLLKPCLSVDSKEIEVIDVDKLSVLARWPVAKENNSPCPSTKLISGLSSEFGSLIRGNSTKSFSMQYKGQKPEPQQIRRKILLVISGSERTRTREFQGDGQAF